MKITCNNRLVLIIASAVSPLASFASESQPAKETVFRNPLFVTLLAVIILFAIIILALSFALRNLIDSESFKNKMAERFRETKVASKTLLLFFFFASLAAQAQKESVAKMAASVGGLEQPTFYTMIIVIGVELLVFFLLIKTFKNVLNTLHPKQEVVVVPKVKTRTILDKINDTVEIEKEEEIMLDHDYDGIRELDNNLPPWWKYGFYLTIVVAVVYLFNYHVLHFSPLQKEEYKTSLKQAEAEIAEYMKNSANNVDESTVKDITDAKELAQGKELFLANCAACHGREGEGSVGPNLTDEYWLHAGGVKDIFKTIKYGWPDKGMKSWKDDFSPVQIAQLTGFIRSLKGTNPAKPKEKQGELYTESAGSSDTSNVKSDSVKVLSSSVLPLQ